MIKIAIKIKTVLLTISFSCIVLSHISSNESSTHSSGFYVQGNFDFANNPENDFSASDMKAPEIFRAVNKSNNRTALISSTHADYSLTAYLQQRMINVYVKDSNGNISPAPRYFTKIGHRGSCSDTCPYTENTKKAFLWALNSGADCIELDIRLTGDNIIVVMHDNTTKRTMNNDLQIEKSTIYELNTLRYKENEKILTFQRFLEYAKANNILIFAELKGTDYNLPQKALELVKLYNMENNVIFISFNYEFLEITRNSCKEIALGYLTENHKDDNIALAKKLNAFYNPSADAVDTDILKASGKLNIPVVLYINGKIQDYADFFPYINGITANFFI